MTPNTPLQTPFTVSPPPHLPYRFLVFLNEKFCLGYGSTFWFYWGTYLPKIWASCPPPPGNQGACQMERCTCTEFELGENHACEYCGDSPTKHSVSQSRPTDSQPMVAEYQSPNSDSISSTKRKEAWKDK